MKEGGMKKAVITGGAGFIGSHLADELVQRGYRVIIFDDLSNGKEANIIHLLRDGKASLIKDSVNSLSRLEKVFDGALYVFHLAAVSSVQKSIEDPKLTHEVNTTGTLNVLLAARRNKVAKVIFASSAAVYGNTPAQPLREDLPTNPKSPYAVSKLASELYCAVFTQVYSLPTVALRYFNVYGTRQDLRSEYSGAISKFMEAALQGQRPVIYGDGEQSRDFIYVKDVVAANILAAESEVSGIFNIGSGESTTINSLARLINKIVGSNKAPVYKSERPGDVRHSLADISEAYAYGYKPVFDLEAGLKDMIGTYQRIIRV